jgi:ATP-dependent RNA helicase DHX57
MRIRSEAKSANALKTFCEEVRELPIEIPNNQTPHM